MVTIGTGRAMGGEKNTVGEKSDLQLARRERERERLSHMFNEIVVVILFFNKETAHLRQSLAFLLESKPTTESRLVGVFRSPGGVRNK